MAMPIDRYFKHMEGVVLGSRYVQVEYENQFGKNYNHGGSGHVCPFCKLGFWAKKKGKIVCPDCGETFNVW